MQTKQLPTEFFHLLTMLESNLSLAEHQAKLLVPTIESQSKEHEEHNALMVHVHYLKQSIDDINKAQARFNRMRLFFVPKT